MSAGDPDIFLKSPENPRIEAGMTPDFFRARLGEMVNHEDPLVMLSRHDALGRDPCPQGRNLLS